MQSSESLFTAAQRQKEQLCWSVSWAGHHDDRWSRESCRVSKDNVNNRWDVDSWNALCGLIWDVTESGADAAEAIYATRPQVVHLPLAPRRRHVTRADLRKYGLTVGRSASSDTAVHGKKAKPHTDERRTRIGQRLEHDPEGHKRLQVHKRRRDAEPEVEEVRRGPCAGDPALAEQQDVETPEEVLGESASVKRGADAVADDEERARL